MDTLPEAESNSPIRTSHWEEDETMIHGVRRTHVGGNKKMPAEKSKRKMPKEGAQPPKKSAGVELRLGPDAIRMGKEPWHDAVGKHAGDKLIGCCLRFTTTPKDTAALKYVVGNFYAHNTEQ